MNAHGIWWERIGSSLTMVDRVRDKICADESVILQVPENMPWKQPFYETVARWAASGCRDRVREILPWKSGANPGKVLLETFGSEEERLGYFPTVSYGEYLANFWDTYMNEAIIWVTDIHQKTDMVAWVDFVEEYCRIARERLKKDRERGGQYAVFVLVYDGAPLETEKLPCLSYRVRKPDIRVFSLELAAELDNATLEEYQAELALSLCGKDPELCAALLCAGQKLSEKPVATALDVLATAKRSDGSGFEPISEKEVTVRVWLAQISRLFPAVERYRYDFILRHEKTIGAYLPMTGSDGKPVTDPYKLDIGELSRLVGNHKNQFSTEEVESLNRLRKLRNQLAHIDVATYEEVEFALK